jgi:hypothetical protein
VKKLCGFLSPYLLFLHDTNYYGGGGGGVGVGVGDGDDDDDNEGIKCHLFKNTYFQVFFKKRFAPFQNVFYKCNILNLQLLQFLNLKPVSSAITSF